MIILLMINSLDIVIAHLAKQHYITPVGNARACPSGFWHDFDINQKMFKQENDKWPQLANPY